MRSLNNSIEEEKKENNNSNNFENVIKDNELNMFAMFYYMN